MKFPSLNLSEVIVILKTEGKSDFANVATKLFKDTKVFDSYAHIISILEKNICPVLKKGGNISEIKPFLKPLLKEGVVLSDAFTNVGSMIPGPVGIVCSLIRATICFCEGNIPMGLIELLGCIPGVKYGLKATPMTTKLVIIMMKAINNNKEFGQFVKSAENMMMKLQGFNKASLQTRLDEIYKNAFSYLYQQSRNLLDYTIKTGRRFQTNLEIVSKETSFLKITGSIYGL